VNVGSWVEQTAGWREDYNTIQPRTSLRGRSPEEFQRGFSESMPSEKPIVHADRALHANPDSINP